MDTHRHDGAIAIVTGAGSGIGRAAALRLAQEGARVVGCDVNAEGLDALVREAGQVRTVLADLTKQDAVDEVVRAAEEMGPVDILANVAGIMDGFLPAHEVDDATWDRVLAVNLHAPMMLSRAVLGGMMERGHGVIVNVASVAGTRGGASGVAYATSKHGLLGLTRSIAATYRNAGIRCNAVCPGGVATAIGATAMPKSPWAFEQYQQALALAGREASADEIAAVISWLASGEASNVNGAVIAADNGWTAA